MYHSTAKPIEWRFTLRTIFLITAYVAFACAWLRWFEIEYWHWESFYPGWIGLISVAVLLWAVREKDQESAIVTLVVAWLLTAFNLCGGFISISVVTSLTLPTLGSWARIFRECVPLMWSCTITLPMLLAIPIGYTIFMSGTCRPSRPTRWMLIVSVFVLIDLVLCGAAIHMPFEIAANV